MTAVPTKTISKPLNTTTPTPPKSKPASTPPAPPRLDQLPPRSVAELASIVCTALVLWICERSQYAPPSLCDVTIGVTKSEALAEWPVEAAVKSWASVRRAVFVGEDRPELVTLLARAWNLEPEQRLRLLKHATELPWAQACEAIARDLTPPF